jgi:lysophospholipase L1-like esterase
MPVIVCFGDSNTYGYDVASGGRYPKTIRWPGVLGAELGPDHEVIEEGLNGRTTIWDDPYLDGRNGRTHLLPCLRSHAPIDVVVIMLGTNDLKTIFGRTAAEIASGAGALVELALLSGTGSAGGRPRVLLVAPPILGGRTATSELWGFGEARSRSQQFASLYRTASDLAAVAFLDAGPVAEVDPADGVHLTAAGHARLGRAVAAAVRDLL